MILTINRNITVASSDLSPSSGSSVRGVWPFFMSITGNSACAVSRVIYLSVPEGLSSPMGTAFRHVLRGIGER